MSPEQETFQRRGSVYQQRRLSQHTMKNAWTGPPLETIYAGVSATFHDGQASTIAIAVRNATYLLDFLERHFEPGERASGAEITGLIIEQLRQYSENQLEKFIGVAIPASLAEKCPTLCSRVWAELDIVPIIFRENKALDEPQNRRWEARSVDEQAESMARKCVCFFGPNNNPLLQVGYRGMVEVDAGFNIRLVSLHDYEKTVGHLTWKAVKHYASDLQDRKVKIAFFSATPQGGGVALMRHALVRFCHELGVDARWYVPKPRPGVFRITKNNHNILQGVALPDERLSQQSKDLIAEWINENAKRYWLCEAGPLVPPEQGGADVIIIDDPQMPGLIPLIKKITPNRPVIYRSHIQIRSDLVAIPGSPQADSWNWLWESIKQADLFISHPVSAFVPHNVPKEIVGYMPASTDWLDGLNKTMRDWDIAFYGRIFNASCRNTGMPTIDHPDGKRIYHPGREFHKRLMDAVPAARPPKLLICGHGSVDDPDGSLIYDAVVEHIEKKVPHLAKFICVLRLHASDQILNALLSKAKIALQLSTREGFEVKVSEAIHKGKPVIATMAGGIPLQVQDKKTGFLVDVGDTDAVAQHLFDLWTDQEFYGRVKTHALNNVSDEVSTVGNTLSWLYLASMLSKGHKIEPNERWINDMAREHAGVPYPEDETRLKRAVEVANMR
ncbi:CAZyme family GT4 [Paecilomyces variotii]|nr:CAZyme family GT4 [Paecilomyces variotii]KAJ9254873.1 CAZyme family GT4 [Paecilomyces variotii]